jgi:subtilisin family serine protease
MKRKPTSRLHLAGTLLVLLLASVTVLSCGKDSALLEPSRTARGSGHPLSGAEEPNLEPVKNEAVLTLAPGIALNDYLSAHQQVDLVTSLDLPAAGSWPATTYYLIRTKDGSTINLSTLTTGGGAVSPHNRIAKGDRGGESFDDNHTWRVGGDYLAQPAISKTRIPQARTITEGLNEIIAILDTGIDVNHPLFVTNHAHFSLGQDYTVLPPVAGVAESRNGQDDDQDGAVDDGFGHGTHVAGIVYTGARKATLLIYKVLDDEGRGTAIGLAEAIKAAVESGAHVINLSLRLDLEDPMVHNAIDYALAMGVAVVASAGNRNTDEPQYPAAWDGVISVTAVDQDDVKPSFSNFGSTVDISAPGVDIISPIPGYFGVGKYAVASGSSMATAFVSAAIALNDGREAFLNPVESEGSVLGGAVDITAQNPTMPAMLGSGRVDFYNSVHHVLVVP